MFSFNIIQVSNIFLEFQMTTNTVFLSTSFFPFFIHSFTQQRHFENLLSVRNCASLRIQREGKYMWLLQELTFKWEAWLNNTFQFKMTHWVTERSTKACRRRALGAGYWLGSGDFTTGQCYVARGLSSLFLFPLLPHSLPHSQLPRMNTDDMLTPWQELHVLISFSTATVWNKYYQLHFSEKETEAKGG